MVLWGKQQQLAYSRHISSLCSPTMLCVHSEELVRVRLVCFDSGLVVQSEQCLVWCGWDSLSSSANAGVLLGNSSQSCGRSHSGSPSELASTPTYAHTAKPFMHTLLGRMTVELNINRNIGFRNKLNLVSLNTLEKTNKNGDVKPFKTLIYDFYIWFIWNTDLWTYQNE